MQAVKDYYFVLGVVKEASQDEIDSAYRSSVDTIKSSNLESQASEAGVAAILEEIEEAYACLSDSERRREYDERLAQLMPPPPVTYNRVYQGRDDSPGHIGPPRRRNSAGWLSAIWKIFKSLVLLGCFGVVASISIGYYRTGTVSVPESLAPIIDKLTGLFK
jgi:curved DNA-binding protein CbpA